MNALLLIRPEGVYRLDESGVLIHAPVNVGGFVHPDEWSDVDFYGIDHGVRALAISARHELMRMQERESAIDASRSAGAASEHAKAMRAIYDRDAAMAEASARCRRQLYEIGGRHDRRRARLVGRRLRGDRRRQRSCLT